MPSGLFSYTAYGLGIHSCLPLPELVVETRPADVNFRFGKVNATNLHAIDEVRSFKASPGEAYYVLEGVGKFLVREGREVIVDLSPDADERAVRLCLLGPIAALVLHQRGRLTLHASTVAVGGYAIAFLGAQGCGKSTLAAAIHLQGHEMVADDVTAIETDSACPMVVPAFPQLKLWPNSLVALGNVPEALPAVHPDFTKRAFRVNSRFSHSPVPLKHIYVLAPGPQVEIETISAHEALLELIGHSYAARFGRHLLPVTGMATHFEQCVKLIQNTSVYRFRRPASLSVLGEHVGLVIAKLTGTRDRPGTSRPVM